MYKSTKVNISSTTLTMFVGVVALNNQRHTVMGVVALHYQRHKVMGVVALHYQHLTAMGVLALRYQNHITFYAVKGL